MARRRHRIEPDAIARLLPAVTAAASEASHSPTQEAANVTAELIEKLPEMLPPAVLAAWLGVSTATIRRRIRKRQQPAVEVLGVARVPAEAAVEQVRARILGRLPSRWRVKAAVGEVEATPRTDRGAPLASPTKINPISK